MDDLFSDKKRYQKLGLNTVTIDIGNSSTKVDFWDDNGFLYRESYHMLNIERMFELANDFDIKAFIVSSVRKDSAALVEQLRKESNCLVVDFNYQEIENHYNISQYKGELGSDRMAAVLGANVIYPSTPKIVVDMGTAMTIDIVDKKDNFLFGNISIGLFSRMSVLSNVTSKLPEVKEIMGNNFFGEDTVSAISCGAINGIVGEILYSYDKAKTFLGVKLGILTGGDAQYVEGKVLEKINGKNDPYLVGRGLDYHLRTYYL